MKSSDFFSVIALCLVFALGTANCLADYITFTNPHPGHTL
jgi:hypothetical protein